MIVLNKGLPFEFKIPNSQARQALHELEIKDGKTFDNVDGLFTDLDSWLMCKIFRTTSFKQNYKKLKAKEKELLKIIITQNGVAKAAIQDIKSYKNLKNYLKSKKLCLPNNFKKVNGN